MKGTPGSVRSRLLDDVEIDAVLVLAGQEPVPGGVAKAGETDEPGSVASTQMVAPRPTTISAWRALINGIGHTRPRASRNTS